MILINDDQCNVADIVLDVWLFEKKLNHSSMHHIFLRQIVAMMKNAFNLSYIFQSIGFFLKKRALDKAHFFSFPFFVLLP